MTRGVLLLSTLQLLAGSSSMYFLAEILLSRHADNLVSGLFGLVFSGCLGTSGLALTLRRRWSWRVSVVAQCVAIFCIAIAALMGIAGVVTASGDFAYADVAGGLIIVVAALLISLPCLMGVLHTMKTSVRALYDR